MTTRRKVWATLVTALLLAVMAGLSRVSLTVGDGNARVRLSWRAEPIRVEECRTLSDEELAEVPTHMRRTESCTGYHVDYELRLSVDGSAMRDTLSPSGLRRDRPVYVFLDHPVAPGRHQVEVDFTALVPSGFEAGDLPVSMQWSGIMELGAGEVGLVTLSPNGRELVRRPTEGSP